MVDSPNRRQAIRFVVASAVAGLMPQFDPDSSQAAHLSYSTEIGSPLLAGRWCIEFTNEVIEVCEIRRDGTALVNEPRRKSPGTVTVKDGRIVIRYRDDRIERWSPVGRRMIVEHWFPSEDYPSGAPILGIAERLS